MQQASSSSSTGEAAAAAPSEGSEAAVAAARAADARASFGGDGVQRALDFLRVDRCVLLVGVNVVR